MGIRSPFFYCYSSRILDFRRSYGKMECLPRNLGGTNDIPIRNDYHFLAFIVLVTFYGINPSKIRKHYNLSSAPLFIFMQISRRGCSKVRFEAFTKIKRVIHSYFISYFTYIVYTLLQKFHSPFHTKDTHIFIRCISGHSFYFPKKAARLTPTADAKSSIVNSGLSNCFSKIVCNFSPNFLSSSVEHKA